MQLKRFSDRIWYLPHSEETDRPVLGYVRGDRCSLMIDAGNSPAHVELFCHALREQKLPLPDYCVLTHWHWDHTFGIAALKEQTLQADGHPAQVIACTATSQKLAAVTDWEWTDAAMRERLRTGQDIEFCDQCIRREYHLDTENPLSVHIGTADLTFESTMMLDLGGIHARLTAMDSPHSRDTVVIEIPEEQVLFLGDASCEDDYENDGAYDPDRLKAFIRFLQQQTAVTTFLGHWQPVSRTDLLAELAEELKTCSDLCIRSLLPEDIPALAAAFCSQGWDDRTETLQHYYSEQEAGTRYIYVAELAGLPVGYVTLLPLAQNGPFAGKFPEISDFNVLQLWQKQGIGSALMDAAEAKAAALSEVVTLGVGLHSGYGSAQKLYPKRGYIPDGSGVWYQNHRAEPYGTVTNDDDLILYFHKVVHQI